MDIPFLNAHSPFSQEVFKCIRPRIPRERWPVEPLRATFTPRPDGLALESNFDDLPPTYARVAQQMVLLAGVDLVVKSPVARLAATVVQAKRWRDAFLFFALPLLFAIPLMGALATTAMYLATGLFAADCAALVFAQILLIRRRIVLMESRFVAEIPVPGMRLHVAAKA